LKILELNSISKKNIKISGYESPIFINFVEYHSLIFMKP